MSASDGFPWLVAAERVFGSLGDALGLRPMREMHQAARELAAANLDELAAMVQYNVIAAAGAVEGMARLAARLDPTRAAGKSITSPTTLLRLGLSELDTAIHAAMLSEPGLAATAATVRAASRRRLALQRILTLGGEVLGQPTRTELDEAFREIQQLKRKIRELERAQSSPVRELERSASLKADERKRSASSDLQLERDASSDLRASSSS